MRNITATMVRNVRDRAVEDGYVCSLSTAKMALMVSDDVSGALDFISAVEYQPLNELITTRLIRRIEALEDRVTTLETKLEKLS